MQSLPRSLPNSSLKNGLLSAFDPNQTLALRSALNQVDEVEWVGKFRERTKAHMLTPAVVAARKGVAD